MEWGYPRTIIRTVMKTIFFRLTGWTYPILKDWSLTYPTIRSSEESKDTELNWSLLVGVQWKFRGTEGIMGGIQQVWIWYYRIQTVEDYILNTTFRSVRLLGIIKFNSAGERKKPVSHSILLGVQSNPIFK